MASHRQRRVDKLALFVVAAALGAAATSSPVAASASPASAGPLTQVSGISPFDSTCGLGGGQSGTNHPNTEVEPWIDVNPIDPDGLLGPKEAGDNIVGSWQQDRWSSGGARGLVAGVSNDGGATWTLVVIPGISQCSGGSYQRATDPWLSFAPNGDLYHVSLSFNNTGGGNGILVNESYDGGATWTNPTTVADETDTAGFNDKESIYADPNDSNFVYVTWQVNGATWFSRTTNAANAGTATWEQASRILAPGRHERTIAHQIVALPNDATFSGALVNQFTLFGKGSRRNVALLRSTDRGATWSAPILANTLESIGISDPETNQGVRAGTNIPDIAVDRNPLSPGFGNLYSVWQDARFDAPAGSGQGRKNRSAHDSIAFSMSSDGGVTWTTPLKVNQTPTDVPAGNQQAFTASVAVANDGTISVSYYDFRNNTTDTSTLPTDHWLIHCHPSTSSCATDPTAWDETRVTDAAFDLSEAPVSNGLFVGDYEGLATEGGSYLSFFSQVHGTDKASVFFRRVGP